MRGDPVDMLRDINIAHGVEVSRHTMTPGWHGERLDVVWAIDVLHPLAIGSTATGA